MEEMTGLARIQGYMKNHDHRSMKPTELEVSEITQGRGGC
jgi:hypothetical protein